MHSGSACMHIDRHIWTWCSLEKFLFVVIKYNYIYRLEWANYFQFSNPPMLMHFIWWCGCNCSSRNNSRPLTIFWPTSAFGLVGQTSYTFSMRQQSVTYKLSHLQKTADQFLTLISSTDSVNKTIQTCWESPRLWWEIVTTLRSWRAGEDKVEQVATVFSETWCLFTLKKLMKTRNEGLHILRN